MYNQGYQELFQALSNASDHVYLFVNDMRTQLSHWSDNAVRYFDLPENYEVNTLDIWMEKIYPDDRRTYLDDIKAVFSGKKDRHYVQYRAQNRYGDYVWLECTGNVMKDEQGNGTLFAGMITRLDNQTKYDPVTKLLSYQQFYQEDEIKETSVVLLFGMDNFRRVIQNYGYEAGNDILETMALVLNRQEVEKRLYRMSGDEFLMILPGETKKTARKIFHKVLKELQQAVLEQGFVGAIRFSASGNEVVPGECDKESLLKRLEHSMEQAKQKGGGHLVFFSDEIEKAHRRVQEIGEEMDLAMNNDFKGFELYYQPVKNKMGTIHTAEALLRFHSEKLGWVSPVEFIPILETSRKIRVVGEWVMRQVVGQCKKWNETYQDIAVGFNVSYLQLYNDALIHQLIREVKKQKLNPKLITVELTESCRVVHPESLGQMFETLISHGFRVALDDFGMEFSSLTLLRDLPVTTVKIDHSFVRTITSTKSHNDKVNLSIIAGIITMCKNIGIRVVVEGIENKKIAQIIGEMDVDFLQGYYYSKPVPAAEAEKLFSN